VIPCRGRNIEEVAVSDRLRQSLMSSRSEIVAGLAEAEAELARVRQRAAELEELIALGTATLLAAEMISGGAKNSPETAAPEAQSDDGVESRRADDPISEADPAPAVEADPASAVEPEPDPRHETTPEPVQSATYEDDLRALLERAQP
jgi:hypothetical protein